MLRIDLCSWQNGFIHLSLEFVLFLVLFFSSYWLLLEKLEFLLVLPLEVMLLVLRNSEVLISNSSIFSPAESFNRNITLAPKSETVRK